MHLHRDHRNQVSLWSRLKAKTWTLKIWKQKMLIKITLLLKRLWIYPQQELFKSITIQIYSRMGPQKACIKIILAMKHQSCRRFSQTGLGVILQLKLCIGKAPMTPNTKRRLTTCTKRITAILRNRDIFPTISKMRHKIVRMGIKLTLLSKLTKRKIPPSRSDWVKPCLSSHRKCLSTLRRWAFKNLQKKA